eukprot:gnl/TRDRNA2_/TRDRNA2_172283_c0_seq3.p1 gnl/TRDRNA2_/TRDRNA2_172283_c0~~gnl/TRDRNA2_/TRDRNA2_172283_c0_seq3.p1  ORF type:complete len:151 (-),score=6.64 gnl/TRDRNA2_/TRDRNA2_172283_c0_seq3:152-604(-)
MPHTSIDTHVKKARPRLSRADRFLIIPRKYLDFIFDELCAPRRSYLEAISEALSSVHHALILECGVRLCGAGYVRESVIVARAGVAAKGIAITTAESSTQFLAQTNLNDFSMPAVVLIGLLLGGTMILRVHYRRSGMTTVEEPFLAAQVS